MGTSHRLGLEPGWTDSWLAKLTGVPEIQCSHGFWPLYNPIEQLVLEQSARSRHLVQQLSFEHDVQSAV